MRRAAKLLKHPNIMSIYDIMQTQTHIFIVLEHLGGDQADPTTTWAGNTMASRLINLKSPLAPNRFPLSSE